MSLPLIAPGELAAAELACKGLFARVSANMRCEVVAAAEVAHADPALERLVSCVDPDVSCQFIGSGEPPVAALRRTGVWPLMNRRLTWSVRILSGTQDWPEGQVLWAVGRGKPGRPCFGATTTRTPKSKIPDSVQWGQGWGDTESVETWTEWFPILDTCRVHIPLASRLEEARVVRDDGEKPRRICTAGLLG